MAVLAPAHRAPRGAALAREALERAPERTPLRAGRCSRSRDRLPRRRRAAGPQHARGGLALARRARRPELEWRAIHFCGGSRSRATTVGRAAARYEAALALAREHGLAAAEAVERLLARRGRLGRRRRRRRPKSCRARASSSSRALGELERDGPALVNIAEIPPGSRRARLRLAFEDTLLPFAEISRAVAAGYVLAQLGERRPPAATSAGTRAAREGLARFERPGATGGRADVWARLANLELAEGAIDEAAVLFERALGCARGWATAAASALALVGLGRVAATAGDYARAEPASGGRDTFRRAGDRWGLVSTLWRTAELEQARGRLDSAEERLEQALAVVGETARRWQAVTRANLAEVALLRGEDERARDLLEQALDAFAPAATRGGRARRERLRSLAKRAQTGGKGPSLEPAHTSTRRRNDMSQTLHRCSARRPSRSCGTRFAASSCSPATTGYDEAKRVWNGAHDGRRPALIARCTGAADVIAALGFARSERPDRRRTRRRPQRRRASRPATAAW